MDSAYLYHHYRLSVQYPGGIADLYVGGYHRPVRRFLLPEMEDAVSHGVMLPAGGGICRSLFNLVKKRISMRFFTWLFVPAGVTKQP